MRVPLRSDTPPAVRSVERRELHLRARARGEASRELPEAAAHAFPFVVPEARTCVFFLCCLGCAGGGGGGGVCARRRQVFGTAHVCEGAGVRVDDEEVRGVCEGSGTQWLSSQI